MTRIPYRNDRHVTYVEWRVRKMLLKMRVRFKHRVYVAGREVDFLIPRPGRRGLLVEVDGDLFHLDVGRREARDRILESEGWEVMHFWGSEVLDTPDRVNETLKAALDGVPKMPKVKKKGSRPKPYCAGCKLEVCVRGCIPRIAALRQATAPDTQYHPIS